MSHKQITPMKRLAAHFQRLEDNILAFSEVTELCHAKPKSPHWPHPPRAGVKQDFVRFYCKEGQKRRPQYKLGKRIPYADYNGSFGFFFDYINKEQHTVIPTVKLHDSPDALVEGKQLSLDEARELLRQFNKTIETQKPNFDQLLLLFCDIFMGVPAEADDEIKTMLEKLKNDFDSEDAVFLSAKADYHQSHQELTAAKKCVSKALARSEEQKHLDQLEEDLKAAKAALKERHRVLTEEHKTKELASVMFEKQEALVEAESNLLNSKLEESNKYPWYLPLFLNK